MLSLKGIRTLGWLSFFGREAFQMVDLLKYCSFKVQLIFFVRLSKQRKSTNSINSIPHIAQEQVGCGVVGQGMLEGEEGTVIAVAVNPAADNVDLIYFSLANNIGWSAHSSGQRQQFVASLLQLLPLMRNRALLHQTTMTDQENLITALLGRRVDDKEIVGFNGACDQALPDQHLIGTANDIAKPGGALKVHVLRGLEHLTAQTL